VYLWAGAAEEAGSVDGPLVAAAVADRTLSAPQGFVRVDPKNQHLWKSVRIGQINANGQFDIVWDPGTIILPRPFPKTWPQAEWEQFLQDLYDMWDENWENPG
ncbi:MAG TPA: transporter substrate-binding protein, partial [Anaerolineae bacterium]|nr:transporter substrate-binding protein [Anaerolineae bacterium]